MGYKLPIEKPFFVLVIPPLLSKLVPLKLGLLVIIIIATRAPNFILFRLSSNTNVTTTKILTETGIPTVSNQR